MAHMLLLNMMVLLTKVPPLATFIMAAPSPSATLELATTALGPRYRRPPLHAVGSAVLVAAIAVHARLVNSPVGVVRRRRHRRPATHDPLVLMKIVLRPVMIILPIGPTAILGLIDVILYGLIGPVVMLPLLAVAA